MDFSYLAARIGAAPFVQSPFRHLRIDDFLSAEHFRLVTSAPEVGLAPVRDDEDLFAALFSSGYEIINFPGCTTDRDAYLRWHRKKDKDGARLYNNTACEGFGVTLRLKQPRSPILVALDAYLASPEFQAALAEKFGLDLADVYYDAGLQKYLDGYEISPHPDIRRKALTYMVNINPGKDSEAQEHHTHYLRLRDAYRYVQAYWEGNPQHDRCWVPWDWCETEQVQTRNNSLVIFAPGDDTLHAVRARYDHLVYQRTQLYGNFWYHAQQADGGPSWERFVVDPSNAQKPAGHSRRRTFASLARAAFGRRRIGS